MIMAALINMNHEPQRVHQGVLLERVRINLIEDCHAPIGKNLRCIVPDSARLNAEQGCHGSLSSSKGQRSITAQEA